MPITGSAVGNQGTQRSEPGMGDGLPRLQGRLALEHDSRVIFNRRCGLQVQY